MIKKNWHFMVLFLVIAGLSIWGLISTSKDCSLLTVSQQLSQAKASWVIAAVLVMPGFIAFEGFAIDSLIDGLCGKRKHKRGSVYAAADIYFSAITPSASGGQPASAFFMMKDGISGAKTTIILLLNLIMYCYALLMCGVLAFVFQPGVFAGYTTFAKILILVGSFFMLALSFIFWMLLKKEKIIHAIALFFINLGVSLHLVKHEKKRKEKLEETMRQFKLCANEINGKTSMLWIAFGFNVLQRISQTLVTAFCYMAIGGEMKNFFKVLAMHLYMALGANSIPIPGGMGVSDYLLLGGLKSLDDVGNAANLALISRGISFYGCVLVSVILVVVGYLASRRRLKKEGIN